MNLLWITNRPLPPISRAMGMPEGVSGGWMYTALKRLRPNHDGKIAVATVYAGKTFVEKEIDGITYYMLPLKGRDIVEYNPHLETYWRDIKREYAPDVVHIHGSEFPHGLAYVRACGSKGVVVALQGIISCIAEYYTAGIDYRDIRKFRSFRDIVRRGSIFDEQKIFERRGRNEIELLKSVDHVMGRTDWDKSNTLAINPEINYYHCGETLRDSFYGASWKYEECEPHSVFVSQAGYPIKGLHILLRAIPLVRRNYPDVKVYVAGIDITSRSWWRITGYGLYLRSLIERYDLKGRVIFTGSLQEKEMCERYLNSNLFVSCSAIENSPNTLGEAQLLRMPHLASYVGGVAEIVQNNPDVLYRFEEYAMLADRICEIFSKGKDVDIPRFDPSLYDGERNLKDLLSAYESVVGQ